LRHRGRRVRTRISRRQIERAADIKNGVLAARWLTRIKDGAAA